MSSSVSHLVYTNPLLLILFVALLLNVTLATTNYQGNETNNIALFAFKLNLHDPQGVHNSWNNSVHFCKWQGITCRLRHRRVMALNLSLSGLVGSLSPNDGNLSFLQLIALQNNSLQGQIHHEFGHLFRLKYQLLTNNSLEGKIPANLSHCTCLMWIRVRNNKLVGKIPRELTTLSNLIVLSVDTNYLRGEIWSSFGNLTSLETLSLSSNALVGSIPDTFGKLIILSYLGIEANVISGNEEVDDFYFLNSLNNCSRLEVLEVNSNQLGRDLPNSLGNLSTRLQYFYVAMNQISRVIPSGFGSLFNLEHIEQNQFEG
ncbi:hypothetical protein LguiB_014249 [Lonicera macranthoides]